MTTGDGFRFDVTDGVGTLVLARPDRLNALTFGMYRGLRETLDAAGEREDVRAIVVTGEGRAFCSGGDVEGIIGELFSRDAKGLLAFTRATGALIASLRRVRKPVVAAVHGVAVGAGAVIALACDMRIASTDAKLAFLFPRVGLCGADMGAAYLLPRVVEPPVERGRARREIRGERAVYIVEEGSHGYGPGSKSPGAPSKRALRLSLHAS